MIGRLKPKPEFFRNVLIVMTGTTIAQLIPILVSPILTRLYTPAEFGVLGFYVSIVAIIAAVSTGKYEFAVLLPKKDKSAVNVLILCIIFVIMTFGISTLVVLIFQDSLGKIFNIRGKATVLYLVPVGILLVGSFRVLNLWLNRLKEYRLLALSRISQTGGTACANISLGLLKIIKNGLVWGHVVGHGVANVFLICLIYNGNKNDIKAIGKNSIWEQARRYSNFPKFSIFASLLEMTTLQMPLLLFPAFFGQSIAGYFVLSHRVTKAPLNLLVRAVGDVFKQSASKEFSDSGNCKKLFIKTCVRLASLSILPFGILFVGAPFLFVFIFGEEWRISGQYTQIMVLSYWMQFVVNPVSSMYMIAGKQKYDLILQLYTFSTVTGSIIAGYLFNSVTLALWFMVLANCSKYLIQLYMSYGYSLGEGSEYPR
jgi:O-antigen/teichoic acid export membrane protein